MSLKENEVFLESEMTIEQIFQAYEDGLLTKQQFGAKLQDHFRLLINTPYERPLTKREKRLKQLREQGYPV